MLEREPPAIYALDPTRIFGDRVSVDRNTVAGGQVFEIGEREGTKGNRATLVIENALLGIFDASCRSWGGYFTAWNGGRILIRNSRIGIATMKTSGTGSIEGDENVCIAQLTPRAPTGQPDYQEIREGGPIRIPHTPCRGRL